MKDAGKTIAKNAGVLMGSQLTTWMLTLLLMLFLPRYLGAKGMGQVFTAIALWEIVGVLVIFGMDVFLTKEIARDPDKTSELLGTSLAVRLVLFLLGWGGIFLYLNLLNYPATTTHIVYIIGIGHLFLKCSEAFQAALQGLEIMEYSSIANIVHKSINTVLGIGVLALGYGIYAFAIVTVLGAFANLLLQMSFLLRRYPLRIRFRLGQSLAMLRSSSTYLFTAAAMVIYTQIDVPLISLLTNEETVGWYSLSAQLYGTLLFVAIVFTTAVFPALARMYTNNPEAMPQITSRSFNLIIMLSVPMGLGTAVIAAPLIDVLFGAEFAPSSTILSIMGMTLIFMYLNILFERFLVSMDQQKTWAIILAVALVATIPLDFVLIPWCHRMFGNGGIGAALSFALTEVAMVLIGMRLLRKGSLTRGNAWLAFRVVVAGLIMAGVTWWVRDIFIVVPILVGVVTYVALVALLRIVSREDMVLLMNLAQPLLGRLGYRKVEAVTTTEV